MSTSPQLYRRLALVAMLGGVVDMVLGIVQLSSPPQAEINFQTSDYLIEALRGTAALLQLGGLFVLHRSQAGASGYRGLGTIGFSLAVVGQAVILASAVTALASGRVAFSLFVLGALLVIAGVPLLAAGTFWAAVLPRWSAVLVTGLLSFAFGPIGVIVNGLVWIVLGYLLLSRWTTLEHET